MRFKLLLGQFSVVRFRATLAPVRTFVRLRIRNYAFSVLSLSKGTRYELLCLSLRHRSLLGLELVWSDLSNQLHAVSVFEDFGMAFAAIGPIPDQR